MEQQKAKVVEQLKLMQSAAQANLDAGGDFYAMHATCAVEFAKNALELLESVPEQEHVEQAREKENARRFSVEVKDSEGEADEVNETFDSVLLIGINADDGRVDVVRRICGKNNRFSAYIALKNEIEEMEEEDPFFPVVYTIVNKEFYKKECD